MLAETKKLQIRVSVINIIIDISFRKIVGVSREKYYEFPSISRERIVPRPILIFDILVTQVRSVHAPVVNGTLLSETLFLFRNGKAKPCKRTFVTRRSKTPVNFFFLHLLSAIRFYTVHKYVLRVLLLPIMSLSVNFNFSWRFIEALSNEYCAIDIVHVI